MRSVTGVNPNAPSNLPKQEVRLYLTISTVAAVLVWFLVLYGVADLIATNRFSELYPVVGLVLFVFGALVPTGFAVFYFQLARRMRLGVDFDAKMLSVYGIDTSWEAVEAVVLDEESPYVFLLFGDIGNKNNVWKVLESDIGPISPFLEVARRSGVKVIEGAVSREDFLARLGKLGLRNSQGE